MHYRRFELSMAKEYYSDLDWFKRTEQKSEGLVDR